MAPETRSADQPGCLHFVGVAGSGMSALALHRALSGLPTSGSDRALDRGDGSGIRDHLLAAGVVLHPQDGSGVQGAEQVVVSTAVESSIPDVVRAGEEGIPIIHRADLLARLLATGPSIAVAGTSGKSTVSAMIFEILHQAGRDPGLITGGDLVSRRERGEPGNAAAGSGPLVAEADESDGSLVRHAPAVGVILNLHRDHMDEIQVLEQFRTFAEQVREHRVVGDEAPLADLHPGALVFGFSDAAEFRGTKPRPTSSGVSFQIRDIEINLPLPGEYNARNALAALATTHSVGIPLEDAAAALSRFRGVSRRFEEVSDHSGIRVIDDFAHNPTKIIATLQAAQDLAPRVFAFFQPHGFGPARFMRDELARGLAHGLRTQDRMWIGGIYYAGGTAHRDITATDLANDAAARGAPVEAMEDRADLPGIIAAQARDGDIVLVMGARDPGLSRLAADVADAIHQRSSGTSRHSLEP